MPRSSFDIAPNLVTELNNYHSFTDNYGDTFPDGILSGAASYTPTQPVRDYAGHNLLITGLQYRVNTGSIPSIRFRLRAINAAGTTTTLYDKTITPVTGQWVKFPDAVVSVPSDTTDLGASINWSGATAGDYTATGLSIYDTTLMDQSLSDVIKLEVATDPDGLQNLIQNPSGELGAWGYITPVPNSVLVSAIDGYTQWQQGLKYITAATSDAAGNYFCTEAVPVAAGQYLAASWHVAYLPHNFYRAKFRWLTTTKTTISESGWQNFTGPYVDAFKAPVQAPANTAYAQLIWEVGGGGSDNNTPTYPYPYGGSNFGIRNVTMAVAATSADLGTIRTNLVPNPSFEVDTAGWSAGSHTSAISRVAGGAVGSYALQGSGIANIAVGERSWVNHSDYISVQGERQYAVQVRINPMTHAASLVGRILVRFHDKNGAKIGPDLFNTAQPLVDNAFTLVSGIFTAPPGATQMLLYVGAEVVMKISTTFQWLFDAVMVERADEVGDYFDGTTPAADGWSYAWIGTPHNSNSRASNANLSYIEPIEWFDIMGDSHDISIVREDLNVGTITATVVNPALDPSVADTLRPGRQYRLTGFNPDTSTFEPLIRGKISNAKVDYLPINDQPHRARITMTGEDNIAPLAASQRSAQVGSIGDLPYVLEGCGVPWNVNGSGNEIASATAVVTNDNASALDIISVARDTALGYAWVDRYGVLQAWDAANLSGVNIVPNRTFDNDASGWTAHNATLARDTETIHTAPGSGKFTADTTGTGTPYLQPSAYQFSVRPGSKWSLGAFLKIITALSQPYYMAVEFYDNFTNWTYLGHVGFDAPLQAAQDWTYHEVGFTVPDGATGIIIYPIIAAGASTVADVIYLDDVTLRSVEMAVLDESVYNPNLVIDFDTDRCINSVSITRQWQALDGTTQETAYGPYDDSDSIAKWGLHPAEFTVAGMEESEVAGYAAQILAANSQPMVKVESLEIPITNTDQLKYAFIDLYDLVRVVNTDSGIDQFLRVTSITHALEADDEGGKWKVTLGFDAEGSVAAPYETPPATSQAALPDPLLIMQKNSSDQAVSAATWTEVSGWTVHTIQGLDQAFSRVTIQQAGLYLIQFTVGWSSATSRCLSAITVNSTDGGPLNSLGRTDEETKANARIATTLSAVAQLLPGDIVRGLVYTNAARSIEANSTYMNVVKIK